MTNRQTAAKLIADGLKELKMTIKGLPCSAIAKAADKHHTSQAAADKARDFAYKFIDPWIVRMENTQKPKPKKAKESEPETASTVAETA
jgi:hypothetical protein